MSLAEAFEQAQIDVKALSKRPDNDTLLRLYALYKQGTHGDATGSRPGVLDFVGRSKWDAWQKLQGESAQNAQQRYVDLVTELRSA
ncbi:acyl-CoA-binding protein [Allocatelliglobosispora scoriae]|uniref:Acyl-CoA-binding protein n=1 Tax=Allocatelliglobosispora scoriae TaxID=643052 RepID=A0A841C420_9ACTN|nr:acyl-CoA-binding protein [Allocatelliglobosispora scoriae]MBB5874518.1 acyl-CoA-binding protein [Allocatelliglobosispora scoriae]